MKRCPYCGAKYPDEATICAIDKTPLVDAGPQKPPTISGVYLAVPKVQKIPVSLLIISYFFLLPALPSLLAACFLGWIVFEGGLPERGSTTLLFASILICASILFWYFLSRGLRHCSRGWRICALIIIWLNLIAVVGGAVQSAITHKLPHDETPFEFWVGTGLGLLWLIWVYGVLTRPDIRSLFYPDTEKKV